MPTPHLFKQRELRHNKSVSPSAASVFQQTKMSISNEALQKLAREIEVQAASAQQQIGIARTQIAGKQREERLVKLTLSELSGLPNETVVYEGVGKMFAAIPVTDMAQKLEGQTRDLDNEVEKLRKRLVYLETTHKNSREHIEQMLRKA
ncbi:hypothetical protein LMH87_012020 [Akanthomyces muscarius]|uniref:Prefoldin subunit 1 n=1 Tax=Akanthomyces muscarius TaxID=2231603 RepID=A0A9W8ULL2_AKAMU|nr:hypothetical protein LMH87_012020 [Akanthomyces muscarius]KAJ4151311.1 hypothetical protein LMH87_012020 [Akanthomyces muscarius]